MRKSVFVVLCVLISGGFVSAIGAEGKKAKAPAAICDGKFDILSYKDEKKVGTYSIKAVGDKGGKMIVIRETLALEVRGKKVSYISEVTCADKDGTTPLLGKVETKFDGKACMMGTVKLSQTGRTYDYNCLGLIDEDTGRALKQPKEYAKNGKPVPEGRLVFQSAMPAIGPRILPAPGEMEDIVFVEFPDDVAAPELINFKSGRRLVRGQPDKNGQYDIKLFVANRKDPVATYRFDKNNRVVSMDLFGKFKLRPAVGGGAGGDAMEAILTPDKPFVLDDKGAKLVIGTKTKWENRKRFAVARLIKGDLALDIVPNTVIAGGGRIYHLSTPRDFKFGHVRESDMIFTVVESCKIPVRSEKAKAPVVELKKLSGSLNFRCDNKQSSQLKLVTGAGKHFVALKIGRTEIYTRHPSKVLGTGMDVLVVNNFGAKKIRLEYMQEKSVTIGPETITIKSVNFKYDTKSVQIKVATKSKAEKAEAVIVEYSDTKTKK